MGYMETYKAWCENEYFDESGPSAMRVISSPQPTPDARIDITLFALTTLFLNVNVMCELGYMETYKAWCENEYFDEDTRAELKSIAGDEKET